MSDFDPFATAPADDEAQAAPPPPAPAATPAAPVNTGVSNDPWAQPQATVGSIAVDVVPKLGNVEFEGKHVVTFKGGTAFSDPWYVVHASGLDEIEELLDKDGVRLAKALEKIQQVGRYFVSKGSGSSGGGGNPTPRQSPPQGATEPPEWAPPKPYADFVYKTGISKKNGSTWHAWMAPEKGDSRDAKFFYPPR